MNTLEVKAWSREKTGKGPAKVLRRNGLVPAVLYAKGYSKPITLNSRDFLRTTKYEAWSTTIFNLGIEEGVQTSNFNVMVKFHQVDPVSGQLLHLDFLEISMDKVITVKVPILLVGHAKGVDSGGGVLVHILSELEVECLPSAIPHQMEIDISHLEVGDSIHVSDLQLDPQVKILNEAQEAIVIISHGSAMEVTPTEASTTAEEQPPK